MPHRANHQPAAQPVSHEPGHEPATVRTDRPDHADSATPTAPASAGGASCSGMSHPGARSAPGVADRAEAAAGGRSASAAAFGPGMPSGAGDDAPTKPYRTASPDPLPDISRSEAGVTDLPTVPLSVTDAVAHYRRRLAVPRRHRINPCFSSAEWTVIVPAARRCRLTPGGFTAAAAVAFSRVDRHTSIDVERRRLEDLMRSNTALGAIGSHLNQLARYLNSGGTPKPDQAHRLLERVTSAAERVDTRALDISRSEPVAQARATTALAADITRHHRHRLVEARRYRTHPCFSDREWAELRVAARAHRLKPGGYAAATALLAAHTSDPRAAIADTHRQLEELMESNRQLAAVGNNLNQLLVHLHANDPLHDQAQRTRRLIQDALDDVDVAATEIAWR